MIYELWKDDFDRICPTLASPEDDIYMKVEPEMERVDELLKVELPGVECYLKGNSALGGWYQRFVVHRTVANIAPLLDLVMTQTGFGIVSTNNLAPASAERVERFIRAEQRLASEAKDMLRYNLMQTDWSIAHVQKSLIYCPMIARRQGVRLEGREVYDDEFFALGKKMRAGEVFVEDLVGTELYDKLCAVADTQRALGAYILVIEEGRRIVASFCREEGEKMVPKMAKKMKRLLKEHENELPEYLGSAQYRATKVERYENKKDDGCFFFG